MTALFPVPTESMPARYRRYAEDSRGKGDHVMAAKWDALAEAVGQADAAAERVEKGLASFSARPLCSPHAGGS